MERNNMGIILKIVALLLFAVSAQAQTHCDSIRQKWEIPYDDIIINGEIATPKFYITNGVGSITNWPNDNDFYILARPANNDIKYPSRYFPEQPHPSKLKLWATTPVFCFKGYTVTNTKLAGWAILAGAGAVDGVLEGYGFDGRQSFERKYNVSETGYFGTRSWERVYKRPNLYTRYFGAQDFYHHADDLRKFGYITGGITVGLSGYQINQKWWHYVVDFAASFTISAATKSAGMYWIRH